MISKVKIELTFDKVQFADQSAVDAFKLQVLLAVKPLYQQLRFDSDVAATVTESVEN